MGLVLPSVPIGADLVTLLTEDFEGLDLGPNVDEGLQVDNLVEQAWSPDGPPGWTVDRSGVPGYGTAADGFVEFAGWNFMDPIWWSQAAGDQDRSFFSSGTGFVVAVADGDTWDDAFHEPGLMNTFMSTPPIPVNGLAANTPLTFLTSWRAEAIQTATITASYDGGEPVEILRWESDIDSDFYQGDLNPEEIQVPLGIPAGAQDVVLTFGYTDAGNNWWWAVDNISVGDYFEDFEGVELGPNVEIGRAIAVDNVWTKTPPDGWSIEDMVPGQDEENDFNGVTEWIGWSFTNKDWWVGVAGDQDRSQFSKGQGTVMVADPDEWDDAPHPPSADEGWYNTFISTDEIALAGVDAGSVVLEFDSSWRPEFDDNYHQTVNITVSFDGGPEEEVLLWESDGASEFFKPDATDETVTLNIDNPAGAQSMVIKFGMFDAGNDWWWAIDNISVTGTGGGVGLPGDYNNDGTVDTADVDLQAQAMNSPTPDLGVYDENGDGLVNEDDRVIWVQDLAKTWFGDANFDGVFSTDDLVAVFAAGKYETQQAATWGEGDWSGDLVFDSGDLVAAFSRRRLRTGSARRRECRARARFAGIAADRHVAAPASSSSSVTGLPAPVAWALGLKMRKRAIWVCCRWPFLESEWDFRIPGTRRFGGRRYGRAKLLLSRRLVDLRLGGSLALPRGFPCRCRCRCR